MKKTTNYQKKLFFATCTMFAMLSTSICANANHSNISVSVNQNLVSFSNGASPFLESARTMIPVRGVFETMGYTVTWDSDVWLSNDNEASLITISSGENYLENPISITKSNLIMQNNIEVESDVSPMLVDGNYYLPIRAIAEATGALVDWNNDTSTVLIDYSTQLFPSNLPEISLENVNVWCELVRVVDGDTIIVMYNDEQTRVRLIGIDTPESVHPDSDKNTDDGILASDYTKNLLQSGILVGLEFDEDMYDIYDRLLAYVYIEDGTMINLHLVEAGMANLLTYPPNTKYLDLFENALK